MRNRKKCKYRYIEKGRYMKKSDLFHKPEMNRKYMAAAGIVLLLLILMAVFLRDRKTEDRVLEDDSIKYTLRWSGEDYEGTYKGATLNGKPSGTGEFTSDKGELTYSGQWQNGKPEGTGSLNYSDGTREEGMYLDGKRHHAVRIYESNNKYTDGVYDYGKCYGCRSEYKDGGLVHETLFANGDHVSKIKEQALELTRKVIDQKQYIDQYVYITGKVVFVYESETSCNFRVKSDGIGMVIGSFTDTAGYRSKQPVMPDMRIGDTVTIYGFYTGTVRDEMEGDDNFYGYQCVQIDPVYGMIESDDIKRGTFASISQNPYAYCGKRMDGEYIVDYFMKDGEISYVFAHPAGDEDSQYVIRIEDEPGVVFLGGDRLDLKGFVVGQKKTEEQDKTSTYVNDEGEVMQEISYRKYPIIRVMSYELR